MLLQSSLDSARACGSVHYVLNPTPASGATIGDVSNGDGEQWIRHANGGRIHTRLVSGTSYSFGNRLGWQGVGVHPPQARRLARRWVSVSPSLGVLYRGAVDQVTLASVLSYITPTGALREIDHRRFIGQPAIEILGGQPQALLSNPASEGRGALFLSRSGAHLPIAFEFTYHGYNGQSESELWRLTSWGSPFTVTAPRHARPIVAVLRGSVGQA